VARFRYRLGRCVGATIHKFQLESQNVYRGHVLSRGEKAGGPRGSHVGLRRNVQDAQFCTSCGRLQDLLAFGDLSFGRSESCNLAGLLIDLYRESLSLAEYTVQPWFARESDGDCRSRLNHPATRVASRLSRPVTLASRFVDLPTDKRRFFSICFLHAILRTKSKEWQVPDLHLTGIVYAKNQSLNSMGADLHCGA
jgi:hypothetical protein